MKISRYIVGIIAAMALVACCHNNDKQDKSHLPKNGQPPANGMEFLAVAGIDGDSLDVSNGFTFDNDGEKLAHLMLDLDAIKAVELDKVMQIDTAVGSVRIWGRHELNNTDMALLMGETTLGDTRTCWMATYGKDGMIDFMRIGNCDGVNLSYWDEVDEYSRHVGIDSTAFAFNKDNDKSIQLLRKISMKVQQDGTDPSNSVLWYIQNDVPVTIGDDGHFSLGKITLSSSTDTAMLTPYWRNKRALETLAWIPRSDNTFCDQVNTFLEKVKGSITDPAQLLGDFSQLMWSRLAGDFNGVMAWCRVHPDSQVARATFKTFKNCTPEYLKTLLQSVTDAKTRDYCQKQLGI